MKNYLISSLIIKVVNFILMFVWFLSKYIITSITGYEWIPVFVTAILFLDLFLLQMFNLPKIFKKNNFGNKAQKEKNNKEGDVILDFNKLEQNEAFQQKLKKLIGIENKKKSIEERYIPKIVEYPYENNELYEFVDVNMFGEYFSLNNPKTFRFLYEKKFLILIDGKKKIFIPKKSSGTSISGGYSVNMDYYDYPNDDKKPDFAIIRKEKQ